ncbi:MAG: type II toxin-antitoxin system RelE family toxin [Pseudonocardiaceae bacterium]
MTSRYTVTYAPRAQRDLRKLPEKIAIACVEFIRTVLTEDPYRVGKPLTSSWEGYYSARRAEWRIIYRIDDHQVLIEVVTIAHRADSYRPR